MIKPYFVSFICISVLFWPMLGHTQLAKQAVRSLVKNEAQRGAQSVSSLLGQEAKSGVRAGYSSASPSGSALDYLGDTHEVGARLAQALRSNESSARLQARMKGASPAKRYVSGDKEAEEMLFLQINPTPLGRLVPKLYHPSVEQLRTVVLQYAEAMRDFAVFKKNFNAKLYYAYAQRTSLKLPPEEVRRWMSDLSALEGRLSKLHSVVFFDDEPLTQALRYTLLASEKLNPILRGLARPGMSRMDRVFNEQEFFLGDWRGMSALPAVWSETKRELPKKLNVAVLNDSEDILDMYRVWQRQGRFGDWTVRLYNHTDKILKEISDGTQFDLIITDIVVPGGGGYYLASELRSTGHNMTILGCSMYSPADMNGERMYQQGFDGYMYGNNLFEEASGFTQWAGYLKDYFSYRDFHGWTR